MRRHGAQQFTPNDRNIVLPMSWSCRWCFIRTATWVDRAEHEERCHPDELRKLRARTIRYWYYDSESTRRLAESAGLQLVPIDATKCPHCGDDVRELTRKLRRQM
jgi:hypothetical protein